MIKNLLLHPTCVRLPIFRVVGLMLFFVVLYSIFYILYSVPSARAETVGMALNQNTYNLEIIPGDSYTGQIVVFNQSENLPLPVNLKLDLWNLKEDSDDIEFIISEDALNATKWFNIESGANYLLAAKGDLKDDKEINFTITPPTDAPPGSYFVIMRFAAVIPPQYYTEQGPRANPEIAALFFIKIPDFNLDGSANDYNAEISELAPKGEESIDFLARIFPGAEAGVFEDVAKEMLARVRNTGIYHFTAEGTITIHNMFGVEVARGELPRKIMMPGRTRSIDIFTETSGGFLARNFNLGPYTATMVLEIPERATPVVETIHFWAFPWKVLSISLFIILAIIILHRRIWRATRVLISRQYIK